MREMDRHGKYAVCDLGQRALYSIGYFKPCNIDVDACSVCMCDRKMEKEETFPLFISVHVSSLG